MHCHHRVLQCAFQRLWMKTKAVQVILGFSDVGQLKISMDRCVNDPFANSSDNQSHFLKQKYHNSLSHSEFTWVAVNFCNCSYSKYFWAFEIWRINITKATYVYFTIIWVKEKHQIFQFAKQEPANCTILTKMMFKIDADSFLFYWQVLELSSTKEK